MDAEALLALRDLAGLRDLDVSFCDEGAKGGGAAARLAPLPRLTRLERLAAGLLSDGAAPEQRLAAAASPSPGSWRWT